MFDSGKVDFLNLFNKICFLLNFIIIWNFQKQFGVICNYWITFRIVNEFHKSGICCLLLSHDFFFDFSTSKQTFGFYNLFDSIPISNKS